MRVLSLHGLVALCIPYMAFRFRLVPSAFPFSLHSLLRLAGKISQACSAKIQRPIVGGF